MPKIDLKLKYDADIEGKKIVLTGDTPIKRKRLKEKFMMEEG